MNLFNMDEFKLQIDINKFRSTNAMWNNLMLNDPWSVGYVSTLIELHEWKSKEEWEEFYYESGKKRLTKLGINNTLLNDFQLIRTNKPLVERLDRELKNLNTQYGRTKEELLEKAKVLQEHVFGLTLEECYECVRFRTICETWNGIILRENNTIATLKRHFPTLEFKKTNGEIDHTYAVDYEILNKGHLICGIQIKPKSYTWKADYIVKARIANEAKNAEYKKIYGVNVYNIIATSKGVIQNPDVLNVISKEASR